MAEPTEAVEPMGRVLVMVRDLTTFAARLAGGIGLRLTAAVGGRLW